MSGKRGIARNPGYSGKNNARNKQRGVKDWKVRVMEKLQNQSNINDPKTRKDAKTRNDKAYDRFVEKARENHDKSFFAKRGNDFPFEKDLVRNEGQNDDLGITDNDLKAAQAEYKEYMNKFIVPDFVEVCRQRHIEAFRRLCDVLRTVLDIETVMNLRAYFNSIELVVFIRDEKSRISTESHHAIDVYQIYRDNKDRFDEPIKVLVDTICYGTAWLIPYQIDPVWETLFEPADQSKKNKENATADRANEGAKKQSSSANEKKIPVDRINTNCAGTQERDMEHVRRIRIPTAINPKPEVVAGTKDTILKRLGGKEAFQYMFAKTWKEFK